MSRLLFAALFFSLSFTAQGDLYRWVDKDGKVQYTDQPPPASATGQKKMDIKVSPAAAPAKPKDEKAGGKEGAKEAKAEKDSGPRTLAEKELDFKKRRLAEEEAEKKAGDEAKQNQEKCAQANSKLNTYQNVPRITQTDAKGEITYVDDAAREKTIAEAQKDIAAFCK